MKNKLCELLDIKYPVIQGGMVWCSGYKLAHAVAASGGLGVIGAGSMTKRILTEHITKIRSAGTINFGVNIPLMNKHSSDHIETVIELNVPIIITSAGNPSLYTQKLKEQGIIVLHVVSNTKFTIKAMQAGVDGIIAEGFEAGGHNGREETTTLCLIPEIKKICTLPFAAAGGIASGSSMFAVMSLGADGVQIGSRYAVCSESSAHEHFKKAVLQAKEGETALTLKELGPVRLLKNQFFKEIIQAYEENTSLEKLRELLDNGRAKTGIFEGDLVKGKLEIGQVASQLNQAENASEVMNDLIAEFQLTQNEMFRIKL
jgi:enoyl-[acyl-carrier protein] reductase II